VEKRGREKRRKTRLHRKIRKMTKITGQDIVERTLFSKKKTRGCCEEKRRKKIPKGSAGKKAGGKPLWSRWGENETRRGVDRAEKYKARDPTWRESRNVNRGTDPSDLWTSFCPLSVFREKNRDGQWKKKACQGELPKNWGTTLRAGRDQNNNGCRSGEKIEERKKSQSQNRTCLGAGGGGGGGGGRGGGGAGLGGGGLNGVKSLRRTRRCGRHCKEDVVGGEKKLNRKYFSIRTGRPTGG